MRDEPLFYTSLLRWAAAFDAQAMRDAANASNGDPIPRPLSLHVHLPSAGQACRACGLQGIDAGSPQNCAADIQRLQREAGHVAGLFDPDRVVVQVLVASGDDGPTTAAAAPLLLAALRRQFRVDTSSPELTLSVGAGGLSPRQLRQLAAAGFNRLILADPDAATLQAARDNFRAPDGTVLAVDITCTLRTATVERLADELTQWLRVRPDRISVIAPDTRGDPAPLRRIVQDLTQAGYAWLGQHQFALGDDALARAQGHDTLHANLLGYCTHAATEIVGLGVGAISQVADVLCQNHRNLATWRAAVDAGQSTVLRGLRLSPDDQLRMDLLERLYCSATVPLRPLERRFGVDFRSSFADPLWRLQPLADRGLVRIDPAQIEVTTEGRYRLDEIATCFTTN